MEWDVSGVYKRLLGSCISTSGSDKRLQKAQLTTLRVGFNASENIIGAEFTAIKSSERDERYEEDTEDQKGQRSRQPRSPCRLPSGRH